ncbi:MAG TPA: DinB family protein [Verrucomicrobiae bacterium]|nr:DinB family protein [Verrucomicrobiae bacterium]
MANEKLSGQLDSIRKRAELLISGLTPDQLTLRPDPSKWSIADCLQHLNLTAAAVQPKIAAAIEKGRRENLAGTGPFSPGPWGKLLIWIAEPPPKFRLRAPSHIAPTAGQTGSTQLMAEFMRFQDGWQKLIQDSEGLNQKKIKVESLFPGLPRLSLAAPIPWMLAHQRRHLLQAENVKRSITEQTLVAKASVQK